MIFAFALIAPRALGVLAGLRSGGRGIVRIGVTTAAVDLCADCVGPAR